MRKNRKWINPLICLSTFGALGATSVLVTSTANKNTYQITTSLNSTSSNLKGSEIPSDLAVSFKPRVLINSDHPFPIYPTPQAYADTGGYVTPFMSHDLAPDYKGLWTALDIPLTKSSGADFDFTRGGADFDDNGWPEDEREFTYQQFFINDNVATYFEKNFDASETKRNNPDIKADTVNLGTTITYINDKLSSGEQIDLNLGKKYENDPYADDTIKVWNDPEFYQGVPTVSSFYSALTTIDLSNNDLWYIPYFGYYDDPEFLTNDHFLFRGTAIISPVVYAEGFSRLNSINLANNHLTILPNTYYYRYDAEGTASYSKWWDGRDITNLLYDASLDDPIVGHINIDGNYLRNPFDLGLPWTLLANKNPTYEHPEVIQSATPNSNVGASIDLNQYQSTALYFNTDIYRTALNYYAKNATIDYLPTGQKIDVDLPKQNLESKNELLSDSIPDLYNYGDEYKFTVGYCIDSLLVDYINDNNLASNIVYDDVLDQQLLISTALSNNFMFGYSRYSTNTGDIDLAIDIGRPQICTKNELGGYDIASKSTDTSWYIDIGVDGYTHLNVMWIIEGTIIGVLGLGVIMVIVYYTVIRKHQSAKRKAKDLQAIKQAQKEANRKK